MWSVVFGLIDPTFLLAVARVPGRSSEPSLTNPGVALEPTQEGRPCAIPALIMMISSPSPGGGVPSGAHFRDFLSLNITWSTFKNKRTKHEILCPSAGGADRPLLKPHWSFEKLKSAKVARRLVTRVEHP